MHRIHIQYAIPKKIPGIILLKRWANAALSSLKKKNQELTIRIVNAKEITKLNETYRHKAGATNVLSFPLEPPYLGDIVICAAVVKKEAQQQNKTYQAHFAHMVIHGVLHLLGYDHVKEKDAVKMEALEVKILKKLGFANPYQVLS